MDGGLKLPRSHSPHKETEIGLSEQLEKTNEKKSFAVEINQRAATMDPGSIDLNVNSHELCERNFYMNNPNFLSDPQVTKYKIFITKSCFVPFWLKPMSEKINDHLTEKLNF